MKIGYDAKRIFHNRTGLGNYCRDLVRILSEYYSDHQYFLYNPKPGQVDRLQADGKTIIERRPSSTFWRLLNSLWRQGPVLRQAEQDQVHIYHGLSGELPRGISQSSIKSIVTIHDLIFVTHPQLYKAVDRKIYFNKAKYATDNADVVVAISAFTKNQIIQHLGTDPNKIKVVYQTCHSDFKTSRPATLLKTIKEKYKLPDSFILNVGTIEKRKNLLALMQAVAGTQNHVVVVGKRTAYYSDIHNFIQAHKLEKQIHFIQDIVLADLAGIYELADMMVYTSLVEGFGIPIIEALYTSTPVICHHEGVFPEAAGPGSLYVDMTDPEAIRNAIDTVSNNPSLKEKMVADGLQYVQRFDDKAIAENMMSIYSTLHN